VCGIAASWTRTRDFRSRSSSRQLWEVAVATITVAQPAGRVAQLLRPLVRRMPTGTTATSAASRSINLLVVAKGS